MESNSYQSIKEFIKSKLSNTAGVLPQNSIDNEIKNTSALLSQIGPDLFAKVLSVTSITTLSDDDWDRMKRELETHYNVAMENGVLIQGEDQQKRDNIWWTSKKKQEKEGYYWNKYNEYLKKSLPPEVIKTIDEDTDIVMDNIEDPTVEQFARYGMVVGHVQSGKTSNYAALVCKAADAGYKFIVVIAGGINNLRNQTQERMNEAFVGFDKGIPVGVGKLGGNQKALMPISLTTAELDFNKQDANKSAQGMNFDNINSPVIMVIKKNSSTLNNVITWLENQYNHKIISNHAMLMIDDESDYASINTKEEDDPTIINLRIRKLLSLFRKSAYVAFTATPYANIFIDHEASKDGVGNDLFPKDFIYALQAPTNYFGARKIFLETRDKHLEPIDDFNAYLPLNHKIHSDLPELPESLYDAIRLFVINVGIRYLRGQGNKHNSMLIHATRFTSMHKKISIHVENYFSEIKKHILAYSKLKNPESQSEYIQAISQTFRKRHKELEFSWEEVLDGIGKIISTIIIREVHSATKIPLEYRKDSVTNAIVVGGTSLSRGFTLEGLSVSYFLRNTVFYDTLMQMGRWFGYRTDYEDICRIYMSEEMIESFRLIIEATEDLFDNFDRMAKAKMTPNDFGLSVKHHPDSGLQVTARNKLKSSQDLYFEMNLDGHAKETSWIHKNEEINRMNRELIVHAVNELESMPGIIRDKIKNNYVWKDIHKDFVIAFLQKFDVYKQDQFGIKTRMPIEFVLKYAQEVNTYWDIALYSGDSEELIHIAANVEIYPEERKVSDKGDFYEVQNRQVSSGSAESISFSKSERDHLGSKRKDIREKMKKPLLMLHLLETRENDIPTNYLLAAFGVSFPGGIKSQNKTIKLKINSVYIQKLINEENFDD